MPVSTWIEQLYKRMPPRARRLGYLARTPPGHYYSPYPNLSQTRDRADSIWGDPLDLPGVELDVPGQWELVKRLGAHVSQIPFASAPIAPMIYDPSNRPYVPGDAMVAAMVLAELRPKRYVEVGSGWSTAAALDARRLFNLDDTTITCIDPFPTRLEQVLDESKPDHFSIRREPVQDTPLSVFDELEDGDVLFIDSTHVVKTGSDVNHLVFTILPRLAPGVWVHVHDVFAGFEYPQKWVEERRAWQEAYLLRAFLQFNSAYRVRLHTQLLHHLDRDRYVAAVPLADPNPGAQIWLQRQ